MKKKFNVALILCLLLLVTNIIIALASSAESSKGYYTVYGHDYFNYSTINTGTNYDGSTFVAAVSSAVCDPPGTETAVPTGYLGARSRLYNSSGKMIEETDYLYNSSPAWVLHSDSARLDSPVSGQAYYSYGITAAYNGNGYTTYSTFKSPSLNAP
ncbi:MAG TPA: hypothetical protein DD738_06460 [Ruminiclostridium sp.]|nr:hypothetical protein [Ruminiclostridium sp.]